MRMPIFLAALASLVASSAQADRTRDLADCVTGASPKVVIAGCARLLGTKKGDGVTRSAYHYFRGKAHYELRKFGRAVADFAQVIRLNPGHVHAHNLRGSAYADLKQYRKVIADFSEAIRLNPQDEEASTYRGLAHKRYKNYDKAVADFTEVIRLNPKSFVAYFNRVLIYEHTYKNRHRAIQNYRKAYQSEPRNPKNTAKLKEMGVKPK